MIELWHALHALWPEGSVFRYFARHPDGRVFGCAIDSLAELQRTAHWADKHGFNSYFQLNPTRRRTGMKCSGADVTRWCFLPIDLDPTIGGLDPGDVERAFVPHLFGGKRWTIDSGRGVQILYPFHPIEPDRASRCMSYWLHRLTGEVRVEWPYSDYQIDTSCSDLPRVMRLPDTINQKTGNRARLLSIGEVNDGLGDWLLAHTPESVWASPSAEPVGNRSHWTQYRHHLTVAAQRFLREGAEEPGRHKAATATMLSLIEQGATHPQVLEALQHGSALSTPPLPGRDITAMVERRFRKPLTSQ